jgi:hypothetical protein
MNRVDQQRKRGPHEQSPPEPLAYRITQEIAAPYREMGSGRVALWENEDISVQEQWIKIDAGIRAAIEQERAAR